MSRLRVRIGLRGRLTATITPYCPDTPATPALSLDTSAITAPAAGTETTINVRATVDWRAE